MALLSWGALGIRWVLQAPHPRVTSSWTQWDSRTAAWLPGQETGQIPDLKSCVALWAVLKGCFTRGSRMWPAQRWGHRGGRWPRV